MSSAAGVGFGRECVTLAEEATSGPASWWSGYASSLVSSGIGETSRAVIEADARHIVDKGVLGAGGPDEGHWPAGRVRTGAVMGAVQSGKTASMMAVTALALDAGVDAVLVLGGTRTALWLQTADRLVAQLDVLPDRAVRRYLLPSPNALATPGGPEASSAYRFTSQQAKRAIERSRPLLAVVMKNVAHLAEMAEALHGVLYPAAGAVGKNFHLLVIDDEADDSSVVDDEGPSPEQVRQVPRRIRDLWESRHSGEATAGSHIFATYLAYTATPQANFLQDPDNPLAPRDFFASLRTPGPQGDREKRTGTYRVPEGARAWYTGGEIFYETLAEVPACITMDPAESDEQLIDTVRAYLVASAVRLLAAPGKIGPSVAKTAVFATEGDARENVAPPMSMLVHPSSAKEQHFESASKILAWGAGEGAAAGRTLFESGVRTLSVRGVQRDLDQHPNLWRRWLDDYQRGAAIAARAMELLPPPSVPGGEQWDSIKATILDEIVPGTTVAVINSDERADDRPRFSPVLDEGGHWRPGTNLSTIFVSGNVMSRGLTLEGLTTTFFSRRTDEPLADTQMQMQRWFGYRGGYIHLCRVMLTADQLELFEHYHQNDEALRRDVLAAMEGQEADARPPLAVLQGRRFSATGKISSLRSTPLWPGSKPFIRLLNPPDADHDNLTLVASLLASEPVLQVPTGSGRQGLVLERQLDLRQTAELLDRLVYVDHRPGSNGPEAARWASVENHAAIEPSDPSSPLYRPPASKSEGRDLGVTSPYWISAYLRLWAAALERHIPGMYTTDEPPTRWNLVDLGIKAQQQPRFSIGLRFGNGARVESGPLAALPVPAYPMKRDISEDGQLTSGWGARGIGPDGIRGDETFDLRARGADMRLVAEGPRPAGSDGQVLFHLVERGGGATSLAVGVVLPLGGPDNIEAAPPWNST